MLEANKVGISHIGFMGLVYLSTFGLFVWYIKLVNVSKYAIHGSYGYV